jgi:hypothetical protein
MGLRSLYEWLLAVGLKKNHSSEFTESEQERGGFRSATNCRPRSSKI